MNVGKRLQRMRQVQGLTSVELARRAKVTTGFISQLEHSHTVPSLQTLQRVAAALGVSLTYFLLEENLQRDHEAQLLLTMAPASLWKHAGEEISSGISMPI